MSFKTGFAVPAILIIIIATITSSLIAINLRPMSLMIIALVVVGVIASTLFYLLVNRAAKTMAILSKNATDMQVNITTLAKETRRVCDEITNGYLQAVGNEQLLPGDYRDIMVNINKMNRSAINYLDAMPISVVVLDSQVRYTFINKKAVSDGYDPVSFIGKSLFEGIAIEEVEAVRERYNTVVRTGNVLNAQLAYETPTGEIIVADAAIAPIKDANGKVIVYVEITNDVTELKNAQTKAEKVALYQDTETTGVIESLQDGLVKGYLSFDYTPTPHDKDTQSSSQNYGKVKNALNLSVHTVKGYVDEISQLLHEFSTENFDVSIKQAYIGDFSTIKDSMERLVRSIGLLVSEIQSATAGVEAGSEEIAQATQALTVSFDEQTTAMSEIKEAVANLTEKTQQNAADTDAANNLSGRVQEAAIIGAKHMEDTAAAMQEIKQSSAEIAKIVSIIEGIAFQTTLLALNASVEAARAGEQGRGFGVVAEEVRSLAGRSTKAAQDTSELISKSLSRVDIGVEQSEQTVTALQNIVGMTSDVAEVLSGMAQASQHQAEEIDKIQNNIEAIYRSTSDNSAAVQSNASVSVELSSQASMLRNLVSRFKIKS